VSATQLLDRLDRARETRRGHWIARCPAHQDRSPSLSIRELDDGRVLIHDFGGCSAEEVLNAAGLNYSDLHSERAKDDRRPRERRPWSISQGIRVLDFETNLITVAALNIGNGVALNDGDRERVLVARERVMHVIEVLGGG
jgi:hypothetical protein